METINIDEIKVSDWNKIQDIKWDFKVGKFSKSVENIITFDTENSTAVVRDGIAHPFNYDYSQTLEGKDFYKESEKAVITYVWSCAIETKIPSNPIMVFIGRTWEDFRIFLSMLTAEIGLKSVDSELLNSDWFFRKELYKTYKTNNNFIKPNMSIFVHNLPYDFQFMRNIFEENFCVENVKSKYNRAPVFAREPRKPMKAEILFNKIRITFKDTFVLTQKSLANWCKDSKLPVSKLKVPAGYYDKIRTPKTKLSEFDIKYSIGDVVSMVYGIEKYRDKYKTLKNIPMTQTGEVRRICKDRITKSNPEWAKNCADIMGNLTLKDFKMLCEVFAGGWVHANMAYSGVVINNVRCFDFASSYPFSMTAFKYPVSSFKEVTLDHIKDLEKIDPRSLNIDYKYIVKVKGYNLHTNFLNTFWSSSKCLKLVNPVLDNGKVLTCEEFEAYMTDLDYDIFKKAYSGDIHVVELYRAEADFLPKELILTILEYFGHKTSLKGLKDSESLYLESKQFINSIYGVAVTKVINDEVIFTNNIGDNTSGWKKEPLTEEKYLELARKNFDNDGEPRDNLFLHFAIGCFVTAYSRSNLWYILQQVDKSVAYGDTDSLKGPFTDDDMLVINNYNKWVVEREKEVSKMLGFDEKLYTPETSKKGKFKRLGIFEEEDPCLEFKTLGAKRYVNSIEINKTDYDPDKHTLIRYDGDKAVILEATIAGLPKKAAREKIRTVDNFKIGMHWNTSESLKKIAYYIDDGLTNVTFIDEKGVKYIGGEKYGVAILPTTFDLSIAPEYEWLLDILDTGESDLLPDVSELLLKIE